MRRSEHILWRFDAHTPAAILSTQHVHSLFIIFALIYATTSTKASHAAKWGKKVLLGWAWNGTQIKSHPGGARRRGAIVVVTAIYMYTFIPYICYILYTFSLVLIYILIPHFTPPCLVSSSFASLSLQYV